MYDKCWSFVIHITTYDTNSLYKYKFISVNQHRKSNCLSEI